MLSTRQEIWVTVILIGLGGYWLTRLSAPLWRERLALALLRRGKVAWAMRVKFFGR